MDSPHGSTISSSLEEAIMLDTSKSFATFKKKVFKKGDFIKRSLSIFFLAWLSMFLAACSGPATVPKGSDPPGGSPSSFELIDEALEQGLINYETAISYKVYVVFGDERLPEKFRGVDEQLFGTSTMTEVVENFEHLPPETKANLEPYLRRPPESGSWYELHEAQAQGLKSTATTWGMVAGKVAKVKVWWDQGKFPQDKANAQMIADELDSPIWNLTTLMGKEPLPDCNPTCPRDADDTRLDIYLVPLPPDDGGLTMPFGKRPTPTYIQMNRTVKNRNALLGYLTHEFMHAIQFAYPIASRVEYRWLEEATANWAIDYVYPILRDETRADVEHRYIPWFLDHPEKPLETVNEKHEYGAYLFFFYLRQKFGQPEIIRKVWENAYKPNSLDAINAVIPGGFKERWPEFALLNFNNPPRIDYGIWDQISPSIMPKFEKTIDLTTTGDYEEYLETNVKHLSAFYYVLKFSNKENRFISIRNPFASGKWPTAKVQAMFKLAGQEEWQEEDWTMISQKNFCCDKPEEDIEKLVLVISNSEFLNRDYTLDAGDASFKTQKDCFVIDRIEGPPAVILDAPPSDFSIYWKGKPTFPLVLTFKNISCGVGQCPQEAVITYEKEENPLPFKYQCYTIGDRSNVPPSGTEVYEARLKDSKGLETSPATFTITCQTGGGLSQPLSSVTSLSATGDRFSIGVVSPIR
jgi:hypothetical protein